MTSRGHCLFKTNITGVHQEFDKFEYQKIEDSMQVFAPSLKQNIILGEYDLNHIMQNHLGQKEGKSFFTNDPVAIIKKAASKRDAKYFRTQKNEKILGLYDMENEIGYDPKQARWCRKLILVLVESNKKKRIITAYPAWRSPIHSQLRR